MPSSFFLSTYLEEKMQTKKRNGISLVLKSHEQMFRKLKIRPIIINDIATQYSSIQAAEMVNELIRTHYADDKLNTLPSCGCGYLTGGFNEGLDCDQPDCPSPKVERIIDRPLEAQIWFRVPDGIPAFVSPRFWAFFNANFSVTKLDLMEWLTNPSYQPPTPYSDNVQAVMDCLADNGIERGLKFFYYNFDKIMDVVLNPNPFLKHKTGKEGRAWAKEQACIKMRKFVRMYRDCIFTRYLPFPSKLVMVTEQSGSTTYVDPTMTPAFDAVKTLCSIENSPTRLSATTVNTRTVRVIKQLVQYYSGFKTETCGGKKGIFRRQLGSTRSPFTGRAVIAPLSMDHEYDEIHTPWAWTVSLLRVHIAGQLLKAPYNMTPPQILRKIDQGTVAYCPIIHEVINKMIADSPEGGIPLALLRNPTLERLSDQPFRITKVLTNTAVHAILISVLAIKGSNADFDGDMLQGKLLIDNREKAQFKRLAAHNGLIDSDKARTIKSVITLHPEVISMTNKFFDTYRVLAR